MGSDGGSLESNGWTLVRPKRAKVMKAKLEESYEGVKNDGPFAAVSPGKKMSPSFKMEMFSFSRSPLEFSQVPDARRCASRVERRRCAMEAIAGKEGGADGGVDNVGLPGLPGTGPKSPRGSFGHPARDWCDEEASGRGNAAGSPIELAVDTSAHRVSRAGRCRGRESARCADLDVCHSALCIPAGPVSARRAAGGSSHFAPFNRGRRDLWRDVGDGAPSGEAPVDGGKGVPPGGCSSTAVVSAGSARASQAAMTKLHAEEKDAFAINKRDLEDGIVVVRSTLGVLRDYGGADTAHVTAGESPGGIGLLEVTESDFPSLSFSVNSCLRLSTSACARASCFAGACAGAAVRVCPVSSSSAVSAVVHAHATTLHGAHNSWSDTGRVTWSHGSKVGFPVRPKICALSQRWRQG